MKFHEPLIDMRRHRCKPESVLLAVDCALPEERHWHDFDPGHALIAIEPSDVPSRLDLRCLIGCTVYVQGPDDERVAAVFEAAIAAGANLVLAVFDGEAHVHRCMEQRGVSNG